MSYARVADGIYQDTRTGSFYERPWISGRRTWRKLDGHTLKLARESHAQRRADSTRSALGLARDPYAPAACTIGKLIAAYVLADHPDRHGATIRPGQRPLETCRIKMLLPFWRDRDPEKINPQVDCRRYRESRRDKARPDRGARGVDLELNTLSNVLRHAVNTGQLTANPLATGRPRFAPKPKRHCRDFAPLNGTELHQLAAHLFESAASEPLGWQLLLESMTGCRTSEVLHLRHDAKHRTDPGFIEGDWLWLARSKGGVNPFAQIHPTLRQCLDALRQWHHLRGFKSPWFIPSTRIKAAAVLATSLTHALRSAGPLVVGRHITSHGMRSYYVTVRRSQGISDAQIAAEIGDKTGAAIIVSTYGSIPPNWQGQAEISWLPDASTPLAWSCFGFPPVPVPESPALSAPILACR